MEPLEILKDHLKEILMLKWSYKIFNEERKKIKIEIPDDHVVPKSKVLEDLKNNQNNDYIAWIGHATFLIKLGEHNNYN
jgi:hypothetical protein